MKHALILTGLFYSFLTQVVSAQIGGSNTYDFLKLVNTARISGMGGNCISVKEEDINLSYDNPAILSKKIKNTASLNYINYLTDINYGYASYVLDLDSFNRFGTFSVGMLFANYGSFTQTEANGDVIGRFKAADYALNIGYGKSILDSSLSLGANLKTIYSSLYTYHSLALAADLGALYYHPQHLFGLGLTIQNVGVSLTHYSDNNAKTPFPFSINFGISKKLKKAPLRITVTGTNLQVWDLTYSDPSNPTPDKNPFTGEAIRKSKFKTVGDKFMRHILFSGEFLLSKNLQLQLGYNYRRRKELKIDSYGGITGFSFGVGYKISSFQLNYSWAKYHLGGASNTLSISVNFDKLNQLIKKNPE